MLHIWKDIFYSLFLVSLSTFTGLLICYLEEEARPCVSVGVAKRERLIKRFNFISGQKFHRIKKAEAETWTLFIRGKRYKNWGFLRKLQQPVYPDSKLKPYSVNACMYYQPHLNEVDKNEDEKKWYLCAPKGGETKRANFII